MQNMACLTAKGRLKSIFTKLRQHVPFERSPSVLVSSTRFASLVQTPGLSLSPNWHAASQISLLARDASELESPEMFDEDETAKCHGWETAHLVPYASPTL